MKKKTKPRRRKKVPHSKSAPNEEPDYLLNYFFRFDMTYPFYFLGKSNPTKELLESTAAMYYVEKVIESLPNKKLGMTKHNMVKGKMADFLADARVLCVVPGDGAVPRTGYLVAKRTQWQVVSVDPNMGQHVKLEPSQNETCPPLSLNERIEARYSATLPPNLTCCRQLAEKVDYRKLATEFRFVVLLHVHSHADLPKMLDTFPNCPVLAYSMPCCHHVRATYAEDYLIESGNVKDMEKHTDKCQFYVYYRGPRNPGERNVT